MVDQLRPSRDWRHVYFGLGTLPAVVATGLVAHTLSDLARSRTTRSLAGIMMIGYGIWTIWGPLLTHPH
jgi:sulfite exporter TauE/SafE